jgi:hypothetical protein
VLSKDENAFWFEAADKPIVFVGIHDVPGEPVQPRRVAASLLRISAFVAVLDCCQAAVGVRKQFAEQCFT